MTLSVEVLRDNFEISQLLYRYARALDSCDRDLVRQIFVDDAVFEAGAGVGRYEGLEAIIDVLLPYLEGLESSQHIITNPLIDLAGDEASSTCYLHAMFYLPDQRTGGNTLEYGGIYHDRLVRTDAGWRIVDRRLEIVWTEGNQGIQMEALARSKAAAEAADA